MLWGSARRKGVPTLWEERRPLPQAGSEASQTEQAVCERRGKNGRKVPPLPLAKSLAVLQHEPWFGQAAETLPKWAIDQRTGCGTSLRNISSTLSRHVVTSGSLTDPPQPVFEIQVEHKTSIVAVVENNNF